MSRLSEFQILAAIRSCEATAQMHEADGKRKLAAAARRRAAEYRDELRGRLDAMLASGQTIPEQLRPAAAGMGSAA